MTTSFAVAPAPMTTSPLVATAGTTRLRMYQRQRASPNPQRTFHRSGRYPEHSGAGCSSSTGACRGAGRSSENASAPSAGDRAGSSTWADGVCCHPMLFIHRRARARKRGERQRQTIASQRHSQIMATRLSAKYSEGCIVASRRSDERPTMVSSALNYRTTCPKNSAA